MKHRALTITFAASLFAFLAGTVTAQAPPAARHPGHRCCPTCTQPPAHCSCTTLKPVVETSYRRQQVTTYRQVAETRYRQQQVVQRVPVTKTTNVTVDEGGYQMVWVPKPVTRQVAYTECEDRVATQTVPYTVTRTVPQTTTQLIPQRTVRYVPRTTHTLVQRPCATCAPWTSNIRPWTRRAAAPVIGPSIAAAPSTNPPAPVPNVAARPIPDSSFTTGSVPQPTPDPAFSAAAPSYDDWSSIPSRSTPETRTTTPPPPPVTDRYGDWDVAPLRAETPRTSGRFTPAPTAASVWRSNGVRR